MKHILWFLIAVAVALYDKYERFMVWRSNPRIKRSPAWRTIPDNPHVPGVERLHHMKQAQAVTLAKVEYARDKHIKAQRRDPNSGLGGVRA